MKCSIIIRLNAETEKQTVQKTGHNELEIDINDLVCFHQMPMNCKTLSVTIAENDFNPLYFSLENLKSKKEKWIQLPLFP